MLISTPLITGPDWAGSVLRQTFPVHPEDIPHFTPARLAAAAVRRLAHALVAHDGTDDELAEMAATVDTLAVTTEARPARGPTVGSLARWEVAVPDGEALSCFGGCMIPGPGNPLSVGAAAWRDGDEAVLTVVLAAGFEGLPSRSHGGIVASLFDEVMGFALYMDAIPAYTAWLRVDYRAAVPVGQPLELRARVRSRAGRKFMVDACLTSGQGDGPTAEALFVTPRRDTATHG